MIEIDGVQIQTNDYVVAETEKVLQTENLVRNSILQGDDPVEAYLKFKKF